MSKIDGFKSALEALRALDPQAQARILGDIQRTDPATALRLRQNLLKFADLLRANPQGLALLFTSVPDAKWVLALRNQSAEFQDQLMQHLAQRRSTLIKAAVQQLGPQPLSKVEASQTEILTKALELQAQGQLLFTGENDRKV